ncbi:MAG: pyruvate, phosphate dikinase [Nitrospirae bacterium]|nr:pyruvate, phosphate dikinase [Nitrospirota bacterium]
MKRLLSFFTKRKICQPLQQADGRVALKYRAFKTLLGHNHAALSRIADLEQIYFSGKPFSLASVRIQYEALLEGIYGIIHALELLAGRDFGMLSEKVALIDESIFENFNPRCLLTTKRLVIPFGEIEPEMTGTVGSKAVNLAMIRNALNLPVPDGFAITAFGFRRFIEENNLLRPVEEELSRYASGPSEEHEVICRRLQEMIHAGRMPEDLAAEIMAAFDQLVTLSVPERRVAMRSSAVGEDTGATFAGQYETVLNVTREGLFDAYREVLASKYSPRAIAYRIQHGLEDQETPMCVAAVVMVDARASGVIYTLDHGQDRQPLVKINALWGLGEQLVNGSTSPDLFMVNRQSRKLQEQHIADKPWQLAARGEGGTELRKVSGDEQAAPSLPAETVLKLADYGLLLEQFFGVPQDVEWAESRRGELYLLQSRPLLLPPLAPKIGRDMGSGEVAVKEFAGHQVLMASGLAAAPGVAAGSVFVVQTMSDLNAVPKDAILVAKTASPEYARVAGIIRGIITDIGSVTSHMASVAREFGLPALVDTADATTRLKTGDIITLSADNTTVYRGIVQELLDEIRPSRSLIQDSPVHRRMRGILDRLTPLNLVDTAAPDFSAEGCRSYHDIIRFTHEMAVRAMFGIAEDSSAAAGAVRLVTTLPISVYLIDLGGGLAGGLTFCAEVTPQKVRSRPFSALWRGFTHPGVNWKGTMNVDSSSLAGKLAATATAEFGEQPGGNSYAILSDDYLNLSVKFAYHFATIDALCGDSSSQNYISLQFSGGAGAYYGRSLRVQLMANILQRLGFQVSVRGDLLDAYLARYDMEQTDAMLDLMGRLLASGRLLDMTLTSQEDINILCDEFFSGNYDFLLKRTDDLPQNVYAQGGSWQRLAMDNSVYCIQDGSGLSRRITARLAVALGKVIGTPYYEFLDSIEAYYYFPLAIVKESMMSEGSVSVRIMPRAGRLDRAGGIAFGIRDRENYFVLRTNALEGNIILFEFINGKRYQRIIVDRTIETGRWHLLGLELEGRTVRGLFNGEQLIAYDTEAPLDGFIGLWTKSDSTIWFDELVIKDETGDRLIRF